MDPNASSPLFKILYIVTAPKLPLYREVGTLFPGPLTHKEACTCKSKLTSYPWRMETLWPHNKPLPTLEQVTEIIKSR